MNFRSLSLSAAVFLLASAAQGAELDNAIRVELKMCESFRLQPFGGPASVTIGVQSNESGSFTIVEDISDNDGYDINSRLGLVPSANRYLRTIRKTGAIDAGGFAKAYLAYKSSNGLKVYFVDGAMVGTNGALFLVVPPEQPAYENPPTAVPSAEESAPVPTAPVPRNPAAPATTPAFSVIGGTLLYGGRALTEKLDAEAARWGLARDVFVEERVWIAKQQKYGAGRERDYDLLFAQRQARRAASVRADVVRMRQAFLSAVVR